MGNRSRYVAVAGIAAGAIGVRRLARTKRRSRLGQAAADFVDTVMPSVARDAPPTTPPVAADEAHAPGHQHLVVDEHVLEEAAPPIVRSRPLRRRHQQSRRN